MSVTEKSPPPRIKIPPEPGSAKTALLCAWVALAFGLAHLFHYFSENAPALDAVLFHGTFPSAKYAKKFWIEAAEFLLGGAAYAGLFAWLGRRRGLSFGQSLAALAPGLLGCVLFASFTYAGAPHFHESAEHYIADRLPFLLILFWPVWRLKLFYNALPSDWTPKTRGIARGAFVALAGLFLFNAFGHALAKWMAWSNNMTDLGLYVQMVWGWTQGRFMLNTSYALPGDCFAHGEHALFSTVLLTPLGWAPDVALALILAQSVFLIAGAWLTWRLARLYSRVSWMPWVFTLMYLASPFLERGWIDDFHIDALEVPLFLALWLVATTWTGWRRVAVFGLLAIIYIGCKEDSGLTLGALGFALLFQKRGRWLGLAALIVGPLCTLAMVKWIGAFRPSAHMGNYGPLGNSASDIAKTVFTQPDVVVSHLAQFDRRLSLTRLAFSTGLLCLLAPEVLLAAGGAVLATLMSELYLHKRLHTHYGLDFLGPIMLAAVAGWARLERWSARSAGMDSPGDAKDAPPEKRREFEWRCGVFAVAALALAFSAHREYAKHAAFRPGDWMPAYRVTVRHREFGERVASQISPSDGVAAPNYLGSLLAARDFAVLFPPPYGHRHPWNDWRMDPRTDVIVLDAHGENYSGRDLRASLRHVIANDNFAPAYYWEGFLLLRRQDRDSAEPLAPEARAWLDDFERRLGVP